MLLTFRVKILQLEMVKNPKRYIFKKTLGLSIFHGKSGHEHKETFKEQKSIEILKIISLITNIEELQKIYNHDRRKNLDWKM